MTAHASQVHGYLKITAWPLIEAAYRIKPNALKHEISQINFMYKVHQFLFILSLLSFFCLQDVKECTTTPLSNQLSTKPGSRTRAMMALFTLNSLKAVCYQR